ncbi:uncharacterized protein [Henckelia pumila]
MNKSECKNDLQLHHEIHPDLTETIWNRIEEENGEFFRAYYVRLVCMQQIRKFNILIADQVSRMRVMALSGVTFPYLNWHQALALIAPAQQNQPSKLAEDMQKQQNLGSSIQPSLAGFMDFAPFCDRQNTEMYSSLVDAPRNSTGPSNMAVMHEVGSSSTPPPAMRYQHVPYLAPIPYASNNPGYFEEKVYDANFGSCQYYSVRPRISRDATMTQTDHRLLITREAAGYGCPYGSFVSAD